MKKLLFALIITIFLSSCVLKRSNPLDPMENDIKVPNEVIGIDVSKSNPDEISISWIAQEDADGYYIYRCLSIGGYYSRIDKNVLHPGDNDSFIDNSIIQGNWYYYKMSAYIDVDGRQLEGWRSGPKTW